MDMLEKLYAELGKLMVQAEILGTLMIPSNGKIGDVKARIAQELAKLQEPHQEPKKEKEDGK
jgi:glycerate-2-kinase